MTTHAPGRSAVSRRRGRRLVFLSLVAVLPLHTVFLPAWISWKPSVVLLAGIVGIDLANGWRERSWPWHPRLSMGLAVFIAAVAVGGTGASDRTRFARLFLALVLGGLLLLVTERSIRRERLGRDMLRVAFWSAAAMALTAFVFGLMTVGAFGGRAVEAVADLPGVFRIAKPAYLTEGFLALTNWHQDPGYAAAWMNLWVALAFIASWFGLGSRRWWVDALVVGALGYGVIMTLSRTGWGGMAATAVVVVVYLVRFERARAGPVLGRAGLAGLVAVLLLAMTWAVDRPAVGGDLGEELAFRFRNLADLGRVEGDPLDPSPGPAYTITDNRLDVWSRYLDLWRSEPIRGIGLGSGWNVQDPHNLVLELLAEGGVVGLAGFVVLVAAIVTTGGGAPGATLLIVALLPAFTQTVVFEMSWWFAAGLYAGRLSIGGSAQDEPRSKTTV